MSDMRKMSYPYLLYRIANFEEFPGPLKIEFWPEVGQGGCVYAGMGIAPAVVDSEPRSHEVGRVRWAPMATSLRPYKGVA